MIKPTLIAASLLLSLNSFAAESDMPSFSNNSIMQSVFQKIDRCLKKGWKAASTDADQTAKAKAFLQTAQAVLAERKDAIIKDKQAVTEAWAAAQISSEAVESAEMALHNDIQPVHDAYRDAAINALNLLSPDQKMAFNSSFMSCHKPAIEQEDEQAEE
ncbi:MAG: hypothetical protein ABIQ95_07585 [Bdellovibrionia bacterium]